MVCAVFLDGLAASAFGLPSGLQVASKGTDSTKHDATVDSFGAQEYVSSHGATLGNGSDAAHVNSIYVWSQTTPEVVEFGWFDDARYGESVFVHRRDANGYNYPEVWPVGPSSGWKGFTIRKRVWGSNTVDYDVLYNGTQLAINGLFDHTTLKYGWPVLGTERQHNGNPTPPTADSDYGTWQGIQFRAQSNGTWYNPTTIYVWYPITTDDPPYYGWGNYYDAAHNWWYYVDTHSH